MRADERRSNLRAGGHAVHPGSVAHSAALRPAVSIHNVRRASRWLPVLVGGGLTLGLFFSQIPSIKAVYPAESDVEVRRDVTVRLTIALPLIGRGLDAETLTKSTIRLNPAGRADSDVETSVSIDGHEITVRSATLLAPNTVYVLEVDGVKDLAGRPLSPFSTQFTTGTAPTGHAGGGVFFERFVLPGTEGRYTSLAVGPDGKLYATGIDGLIRRWKIEDDGTLSHLQVLPALMEAEGRARLLVGFAFDPSAEPDRLVAWVTHTTYGFTEMPDWGGNITRLSGRDLEKVEDFVVGLPRSVRDHVTNGLVFGPDGALYVSQGSNTSNGESQGVWGDRPERLLSGAILRVDVHHMDETEGLPINVRTEDGGSYDPFAPDAPVKIFASGVRNAYGIVWHSNGYLYVPINGSGPAGRSPASLTGMRRPDKSIYAGPDVPGLDSIDAQTDLLQRVPAPDAGGSYRHHYLGHPNPTRGEFVLNGGNPTSSPDPFEVARYPAGTNPDPAWTLPVYDFGLHRSPGGVVEYRSSTFSGALEGRLLVTYYSARGAGNMIVLKPDQKSGEIPPDGDALDVPGLTGFANPLAIVLQPNSGNLYVSEFGGAGRIVLLRPVDVATRGMDAATIKAPSVSGARSRPSPIEPIGELDARAALPSS